MPENHQPVERLTREIRRRTRWWARFPTASRPDAGRRQADTLPELAGEPNRICK